MGSFLQWRYLPANGSLQYTVQFCSKCHNQYFVYINMALFCSACGSPESGEDDVPSKPEQQLDQENTLR